MFAEPSTPSTSHVLDDEPPCLAETEAGRRREHERETKRARTLVRCRRAYWAILLSSPYLPSALAVIVEQAKGRAIVELASALRRDLEQGRSADAIGRGLRALSDALDRTGDEHAVSDALVALAARLDAGWHMDAVQARRLYLMARNRFIDANLHLVVACAHRYGAGLVPLADRIQAGTIGLRKATDRFDPEHGVRFATYARWWIRHMISSRVDSGMSHGWEAEGLHATELGS